MKGTKVLLSVGLHVCLIYNPRGLFKGLVKVLYKHLWAYLV